MREPRDKRGRWACFKCSPEQYARLQSLNSHTTCRSLSEYLRDTALKRPVRVNYRNQSLDELHFEMIRLKNELNQVGADSRDAVRHLLTFDRVPEVKTWLLANEKFLATLLERTEEIRLRLIEIYQLCSQQ